MRAIILAAGAGTRLRPLTDGRPKCLVPIAGRPLVDHQVDALRQAGVDDLVLVVGFEADQIRDHLGGKARYVVNRDWASTNSIVSLHCAREHLAGEVFLFNCDVLFHADVVDRLAQAPGSAIAVDTRAPRATGEMNVRTDERGRVTAIGKHLDPQSAQGVSVQLVRFNAAGSASVRSEVERLIRDEPDAFPTSAYGPMIDSGGLSAVDVGELPWAEIDTVEDYEQAERRVAPRLFRVRQAGS